LSISANTPVSPQISSHRLQSIDFLRGLIMIIMALDHVRDFFTVARFDPVDLTATTAPYFLTRWITHFCAPVFSLLTGVGAYLWYSRGYSDGHSRGRTKPELSRFLLTRGIWLVILEITITRCLEWQFNFDYHFTLGGVLWILGWSMIVLAGAVWLPMPVFTAVALITIVGHNALDGIAPDAFGDFAWLWKFLHTPGILTFAPGYTMYTAYVLIPWFAVMMAGFSLGQVFLWESARRERFLLRLGIVLTALFILVRGLNQYGDPSHWAPQKSALFTVLSFLNCTKYAPSLDYLLMTLGPSIVLLALLDRFRFSGLRPVTVFGRVPMFYYLVHIALIHLAAVAVCFVQFGSAHWLLSSSSIADFPSQFPPGWGFRLAGVYLVWILLIASLYPLCRWFAGVKHRNRAEWLSYF
jgi:uncharacterized membrane protein